MSIPKNVKIKGSEVGFSLTTIERILQLKHQLKIRNSEMKDPETIEKSIRHESVLLQKHTRSFIEKSPVPQIERELSGLLYQLFKPEQIGQQADQELLEEAKEKNIVINPSLKSFTKYYQLQWKQKETPKLMRMHTSN